MVRNSAIGKLRMRKLNTKRAVPLDVVPERRTKRCPPEISARGSLLWAKLQIPVVTGRQRGREMSAPRPYVTDPFHPLSSVCDYKQFLYICESVGVISSVWYRELCLGKVHIWQLRMRFCGSTHFKVQSHYLGFVEFHTMRGKKSVPFKHAHSLNK